MSYFRPDVEADSSRIPWVAVALGVFQSFTVLAFIAGLVIVAVSW